MSGIPSAQYLSHLRIRAVPEAAQVPGKLNGSAVGREQRQGDRFAPWTDLRRFGEAEELLQFDRCRDAAVGAVIETDRAPAGDGNRFGRVAIQRLQPAGRYRSFELYIAQR